MDTAGSEDEKALRLLTLWQQLSAGLSSVTEITELMVLLGHFLMRAPAVRKLPPDLRADVCQSFIAEKLLDGGCPVRAPHNLIEFTVYVRHFVRDQLRQRGREVATDPQDLADLLDADTSHPHVSAEAAAQSSSEFATRSVADRQRQVVERWLGSLPADEVDLIREVHCQGEALSSVDRRLNVTHSASKARRIGLRVANVHADSAWSSRHWFTNTKLGKLFRSLDITGERDMLADAQQVLRLICHTLLFKVCVCTGGKT